MQPAFGSSLTRRAWRAMTLVCSAASASTLILACATAPPASAPITPAERIQRDQALGTEIARQFDAQLKFKQDKDVLSYLNGLARALSDATPELRSSAVEVLLVQDVAVWRDFGLPGHRIYLSSSLLRRLGFENQIAAAMAFELAHILRRHALLRVQEEVLRARKRDATGTRAIPIAATGAAGSFSADYPSVAGLVPSATGAAERPIEYIGPHGVFDFPDDFHFDAAEAAVDILYKAGFDPRGLVSLWEIYGAAPERSPYGKDLLAKLTQRTRRVIALHAPLRNPIVRSPSFLTIQKRIRKL